MKHHYKEMPENLKGTYADYSHNFGFNWKEFVMTVPSPLLLVTTYKSNGLPNACMQSWATFTCANKGNGYYAILASVNKNGHFYKSLKETGDAVINFMSAEIFKKCMATIKNNQFEVDEITASGLTVDKASWVNAPLVEECFMNLESKYVWEKEIAPGDDHVLLCLEIIGAHIDDEHLSDRTGENGILFNIHHQQNPKLTEKTCHDWAAVLTKKVDMGEY